MNIINHQLPCNYLTDSKFNVITALVKNYFVLCFTVVLKKNAVIYSLFKDTTILYFARSAAEELDHKRLHKNASSSLGIIKRLQKNAFSIIKKSGVPFHVFSEKNQVGKNFTEKLINSIKVCFEQTEKVIIVGYDCPLLNVKDLHNAASLLSTGNNVLGKDRNGGAYLIGLHRNSWNEKSFADLKWQTNKLAFQLENEYFKNEELVCLRSKSDLNTECDILSLSFITYLSSFIKVLLQLFKEVVYHPTTYTSNKRIALSSLQFRGPPSFF